MKSFSVRDADFRTSSYSDPGGIIKTCVEVAIKPEGVAVRNSNDKNKTTIFFTPDEWRTFLKGARAGEFE